MSKPLPFDINNIELMTVRDIQGLLKLSYQGVIRLLKTLPEQGILRSRSGRGRRYLVHSWALARYLQLESCPGCGRPWPENEGPPKPWSTDARS